MKRVLSIPKCLAPLGEGGRVIDRTIDWLIARNVKQVVLCPGPLIDAFAHYRHRIPVYATDEPTRRGTGGAVARAFGQFAALFKDQPYVPVLNGDTLLFGGELPGVECVAVGDSLLDKAGPAFRVVKLGSLAAGSDLWVWSLESLPLVGLPFNGAYLDCGTPKGYELARRKCL